MSEYPKFLFSAEEPQGRLLHSRAEEDALKGDWYDNPSKIPIDEHIAADVFTDALESQSTLNDPPPKKKRGRPRKVSR